MGYSTDYVGAFKCSKPLTHKQSAYLVMFGRTRRMKRNQLTASALPDPVRIAANQLRVGLEGAYFTGGVGFAGQDWDASVVDDNQPPAGQPGLWCKWTADDTGRFIGWDGCEKFYDDIKWLEYLIEHFLEPWGIALNGVVRYKGEDRGDFGSIVVIKNVVAKKAGVKVRVTNSKMLHQESTLRFDGSLAKA